MKIPGRGNTVAIVLAGLAVVIAGTGTAVAITATVVNIADPIHSSQVARVDKSGRLTTASPTSTINVLSNLQVGVEPLTSPTNATLAITRVAFFNPEENTTFSNTDFIERLVRIDVDSAGTCEFSGSFVTALYSIDRTADGVGAQDTYPAPLVISPDGSTRYCLGVNLGTDNGTPGAYVEPYAQLTGYVVSGTYTGFGTHARPSTSAGLRLVTPTHK